MAGREPRIKDSPPLIYHPRNETEESLLAGAHYAFAGYRESLPDDRRRLVDRYEVKDLAIKVVGVGSVGTVCTVMLLMADDTDPLFLQLKQARASVLEPYTGRSEYPNHGQRIVNGYRLVQSASDVFLGWTKGKTGRHYFVRQLRDMKLSPLVELFTPALMLEYAALCGWTLARAHARSGESAQISGYLGKSEVFDTAIGRFAVAYADQNERDHEVLRKAVQSGQVDVVIEPD
jgi:uncharacterized protein (DUF2252 family)